MKCLLVTLIALVATTNALNFNGFKGRWNFFGVNAFYDLPKTEADAINENWTLEDRPDDHLPSLKLYCYSNKIFCILYDDLGYAAGTQVCYPEANVTDLIYDWGKQGYISWIPTGSDSVFWCQHQYFVNEEYLAIDKQERLDSRDSSKLLPLDTLYVMGNNREMMEIHDDIDWVESSDFLPQNCVPTMGHHYYYKMNESLVCNDDTMYPWFLLFHNDRLVGTGVGFYGKMPEDPVRDWSERPPKLALEIISPHGPKCYFDIVENPGIITVHIFFVTNTFELTCLDHLFG